MNDVDQMDRERIKAKFLRLAKRFERLAEAEPTAAGKIEARSAIAQGGCIMRDAYLSGLLDLGPQNAEYAKELFSQEAGVFDSHQREFIQGTWFLTLVTNLSNQANPHGQTVHSRTKDATISRSTASHTTRANNYANFCYEVADWIDMTEPVEWISAAEAVKLSGRSSSAFHRDRKKVGLKSTGGKYKKSEIISKLPKVE